MYLFETTIPHHVLNAWYGTCVCCPHLALEATKQRFLNLFFRPSFPKGRHNVFVQGQQGVSVPQVERQRLLKADVHSSRFSYDAQELSVTFDIWDLRYSAKADSKEKESKYIVQITKYVIVIFI